MDLANLYHYMNNDKERVKRFLGIFLSEVPKQLMAIQTAVAIKDTESVSVLAHAIKSQCSYLGLEQLEQIAFGIEMEAESNKINLTHIRLLENKLQSTLSELQVELQNLSLNTNL